jgi:hypothetical protein
MEDKIRFLESCLKRQMIRSSVLRGFIEKRLKVMEEEVADICSNANIRKRNISDHWNSVPPDVHHLSSDSTSSQPNHNSPVFSLSLSVFLKIIKIISYLFLLSLTA